MRASGRPYSTGVATAALTQSDARDHQAGVLAPEPERVRERELEPGRLARPVGHVVEIAFGVGLFVVDRRWQQPTLDGAQRGHCLDSAGPTEQVADRRLDRRGRR